MEKRPTVFVSLALRVNVATEIIGITNTNRALHIVSGSPCSSPLILNQNRTYHHDNFVLSQTLRNLNTELEAERLSL